MNRPRLSGAAGRSSSANSSFTRRGSEIINNANSNPTVGLFASAFHQAEEEAAPTNPVNVNVNDIPRASIRVANAELNYAIAHMDQADSQNEATDPDNPQQQADEATADETSANPNARVPNERLAQIRANFTIQGIRANSRASSTFAAHQRNNERLILFLYDGAGESGVRGEYASMLTDELCHSLDDIKVDPDYTSVIASHRKYNRGKGKKTLQQRKDEYLEGLLRAEISSFLGPPGSTPPRQTVIFDAFILHLPIHLHNFSPP